jgi:type I restriction enzyme R subunit
VGGTQLLLRIVGGTRLTARNFGHLLDLEPVLVVHGAAAEAALFTDPNTAMFKCRSFGEALTARAFIVFGHSEHAAKQFSRLKVLSGQGFLPSE